MFALLRAFSALEAYPATNDGFNWPQPGTVFNPWGGAQASLLSLFPRHALTPDALLSSPRVLTARGEIGAVPLGGRAGDRGGYL